LVTAELLRADGACRWLQLTGDASGELWYNAHGPLYESVEFDGVELVRVRNIALRLDYWLVPRIEFVLPTRSGALKAAIDVRTKGHRRLSTFRLSIDGRIAYSEGAFNSPDSELPLPSHAPAPDVSTLPVPTEALDS
jgi:hypothetical protein